ncbi:MAG: PHP domain-containing protein [Halobacteriota archaeon]
MDCPRPVSDLHVHTRASDGSLSIGAIPQAAAAADLDLVAVTDHDVIHPEITAPVVELEGVTLVRGIELRVDAGSQSVDLLGYAVDPTPPLEAELDRLQRDRKERGAAIVDRVESRLGVDLDLEPSRGIGRPHVARAIAASDAPYDVQGAFDDLIGDGGPCYVPRALTPFERGRSLLSDSCAVVSLAHPFRYPDPDAALALAPTLEAIERYYPYGKDVDTGPIDRLVREHDLLVTGGSDAHDATLGVCGVSGADDEAFRSRLPRAEAYTPSGV